MSVLVDSTPTRAVAVRGLLRRGAEVLLHAMVLSVFVEGLAVGPVSSGRVLAAVGALAVVLAVAVRPSMPGFPHPWVAVPAGLMTSWTLVSGIWASDRAAWLEAVFELALALAFFVTFSLLIDSRELLRRLLVTFAVGATVVAPVALVQVATGVRAVGLQGDPNTFALYQLAAVPLAVFLVARSGGFARLAWILAGLLVVLSLLAAQSRGASLGLVVVVFWLLWSGTDATRSPVRRLAVTAGGGLVLLVAASAAVALLPRFDLALTLEDGGTGRADIWRTAALTWWEHPLLGIGAGGYEPVSGQLLSQTPGVVIDPYSVLFEGIRVHNSFLEPLVEQGPLGLLLYGMLLAGIGLAFDVQRRLAPGDVVAALVPMLLGFIASSLFLSVTANKLLWMLAGFAAVLPYLADPVRPADPADPARPAHPPAPDAESMRETP